MHVNDNRILIFLVKTFFETEYRRIRHFYEYENKNANIKVNKQTVVLRII